MLMSVLALMMALLLTASPSTPLPTDSWWTTETPSLSNGAMGMVVDPMQSHGYTTIVVDRHGFVRCSPEKP